MNTPFPEPSCWLAHRISYGETDAMGVVYYANYLHLFERGRSELIRGLGFSYSVVEERGIFLPVREATCRYLAPARYDEIIHIRTGLSGQSRASLNFVYEITNADKSLVLTRGTTQHAVVNAQGRPVRIPDWLSALFD
ncbi:MAG: acyl-CoA thioesterase [Desulfomicrobium sp.]|nr:acyl-CoA thioesterase [Pseudomonadota bacterium]MBV1714064.1 acyl-CoA thioesterase [Desulfomicrobium sp.]MBU4571601.1 acyl-CoA thioesterase [Pseudomonadota bacterium]MBU4595749.1 acyl-CoA thioesterase [Pseudomonadota bacterium]MBV1721667.1 acyl-CoA thioesterase [Desulfomicrobium sp.]